MDAIISQKSFSCSKHPYFNLESLQIKELRDDQKNSIFYCLGCIDEDNSFQQKNYLLIYNIISNGLTQIIPKWPPLNDDKIIENLGKKQKSESISYEEQINEFFDKFITDLINKIQVCKKKLINIACQLQDYKIQIVEKYQEISKVVELRSYLIDESTTINQKEAQCRQLIEKMGKDKDTNSQLFQQLLEKYDNLYYQIDFDFLQNIKTQVLSFVDNLNLLSSSNKNDEAYLEQLDQLKNKKIEQTNLTQNNQSQKPNDLLTSISYNLQKQNLLQSSQIEQNQGKIEQNLLQNLQFIQTQLNRQLGNFMFNQKDNYQIEIKIDNDIPDFIQCVSDIIIERYQKYIFIFKIESNSNYGQFGIGLVQDSNKDRLGLEDRLACYLQYGQNQISHCKNYGIQKLIRSNQFKVSTLEEQIQIKICLDNSVLEISNYPKNNSRIQIDDFYKNNLSTFKNLRLFFCNKNQAIKIMCKKAYTVKSFD